MEATEVVSNLFLMNLTGSIFIVAFVSLRQIREYAFQRFAGRLGSLGFAEVRREQ